MHAGKTHSVQLRTGSSIELVLRTPILLAISFLCTVVLVLYYLATACRRCSFSLLAVAGRGHGGEPAGPGAEPARAPPVLQRLLRRGGRRERPACPVPAPHGDEPRQSAARALRGGRRRRRGGRPAAVAAAGGGRLLALLVEAAAEGARVVRRGAHAGGSTAPGGGRGRDADGLAWRAGGEVDAGGRGGAVAGDRRDRAAGPTRGGRRHERLERLEWMESGAR
uniref:Uncharacterized protein n=1 Tax=Triticum urartu TaxID=4572 RepID=A0A8R7QX77_TRIUA